MIKKSFLTNFFPVMLILAFIISGSCSSRKFTPPSPGMSSRLIELKNDIKNSLAEGDTDRAKHEIEKALNIIRELPKGHPEKVELFFFIGSAFYENKDYDNANRYLALALNEENRGKKVPGRRIRRLIMLGNSLQRSGERDSALKMYREAECLCHKTGKDNTLTGALLMSEIAFVLESCGKSKEALEYARKSLEIYRANDPGSREYIENLILLGEIHLNLGQLDYAEDYSRKALALLTGDMAPGILYSRAFQSLAIIEEKKNNIAGAIKLYNRAVDARKKSGPDIVTVELHEKIGELLDKSGEKNRALAHVQKAKDLRRSLVADPFPVVGLKDSGKLFSMRDDPCKAVLLQRLGCLARENGDFPLAKKAFENVTRIFSMPEYKDQKKMAVARNDLARLLISTGEFEQAESLVRESIRLAGSIKDFPKRDLVNLRITLGEVLFELGKYGEAKDNYLLAARFLKENELTDENAVLKNNMATMFRAMGDLKSARESGYEALDILKRLKGENHPSYAVILINLATTCHDAGDYEKAGELLEQARKILESQNRTGTPAYASYLQRQSVLKFALGRYDESKKLAEKALELQKSILGDNHPEVATTMNQLASIAIEEGRADESYDLALRAFEIDRQVLGESHPDTVRDLMDMARAALRNGDTLGAEKLAGKVMKIKTPEITTAKLKLLQAKILKSQGKIARAENKFKESIDLIEKSLGAEHPELIPVLSDYAELVFKKEPEKAKNLIKRAIKISDEKLGKIHPHTRNFKNKLALILARERKFDEVLEILRPFIENPVQGDSQLMTWEILLDVALEKENIKKAMEYYKNALDLAKQLYPPGHPRIKELEKRGESLDFKK